MRLYIFELKWTNYLFKKPKALKMLKIKWISNQKLENSKN